MSSTAKTFSAQVLEALDQCPSTCSEVAGEIFGYPTTVDQRRKVSRNMYSLQRRGKVKKTGRFFHSEIRDDGLKLVTQFRAHLWMKT